MDRFEGMSQAEREVAIRKALADLTMADLKELEKKIHGMQAERARKIYSECKSLRKTAAQMALSHETVRRLVHDDRPFLPAA